MAAEQRSTACSSIASAQTAASLGVLDLQGRGQNTPNRLAEQTSVVQQLDVGLSLLSALLDVCVLHCAFV